MLKDNFKNNYLSEKENNLFIYTVSISIIISIILIANIFIRKNNDYDYLGSTITFIRSFNFILSILAFTSCIIAYNRLKNDSIFIISLMYLALSIGILLGHIDYLTFYNDKINISNYIVVSTSLLRVMLLVATITPKSKLRRLIVNYKKISVVFVIAYTIVLGFLEYNYISVSIYYSEFFFIFYNIFLMLIYVISSIKLIIEGIKEKEYLFIVLSSSIFMLGLKAIYAIYGIRRASFYAKLISVSITYICFCIVIIGSFIELYLYMYRTKVLNDNLNVFYNFTDNNKHSFMFITNEEGKVLYANNKIKEFYFGLNEFHMGDLDKLLKERMKSTGKREEIINSLNETGLWRGIIDNKNDNRTIDCSVQLISTSGEEKKIAVTYMDISEEIRKELELEKLKIYDKEKSKFISNMSHELKTPLNIFYSTVQLLDKATEMRCSEFKSIYLKYKKSLHINCMRMMRLINNFTDISKIDMGILKADFNNYDIVFIAEEVTLSVVNYALSKSIQIQFDTNKEEHIIKCDALMIERAILNLLSNAIKFSKEENEIFVNILVEDEYVIIEIRDQGIGISDNNIGVIFERFVQVDKSFTRMNEGSGIGLSIVKSIVELHNGIVEVDSKENEGSTFKIVLPNERLSNTDMKPFYNNNYTTELELSDIYGIVN